jgi:N-acetylglutamate synthase
MPVSVAYGIRPLLISDYAEVYQLWSQSDGMSLQEDDDWDRIELYLGRNPGLCYVAVIESRVVGSVLCGHDGRRAVLRHLAVEKGHRNQGIGRALIAKVLAALRDQGIRKCNIYVLDNNAAGLEFWQHMGARLVVYDWRTLQISVPGAGTSAPTPRV